MWPAQSWSFGCINHPQILHLVIGPWAGVISRSYWCITVLKFDFWRRGICLKISQSTLRRELSFSIQKIHSETDWLTNPAIISAEIPSFVDIWFINKLLWESCGQWSYPRVGSFRLIFYSYLTYKVCYKNIPSHMYKISIDYTWSNYIDALQHPITQQNHNKHYYLCSMLYRQPCYTRSYTTMYQLSTGQRFKASHP